MGYIIGMRQLVKIQRLFAALIFGILTIRASAQANVYLFTGAKTNVTLSPGTYNITVYGAQGGWNNYDNAQGGLGAQMEAKFYFSVPTTLTLLVGGVGGGPIAGGGGGSFVVNGSTPLVIAGGGGDMRCDESLPSRAPVIG